MDISLQSRDKILVTLKKNPLLNQDKPAKSDLNNSKAITEKTVKIKGKNLIRNHFNRILPIIARINSKTRRRAKLILVTTIKTQKKFSKILVRINRILEKTSRFLGRSNNIEKISKILKKNWKLKEIKVTPIMQIKQINTVKTEEEGKTKIIKANKTIKKELSLVEFKGNNKTRK